MGGNISFWGVGGDCGVFVYVCEGGRKELALLTSCVSVFSIPRQPLCSFLYATEVEGEDETVLKEATVLISSEGSFLFFSPLPFLS